MRFSLYGGSVEEETALIRFAERLGAEFCGYEASEVDEPILVIQCLPRKLDLLGALGQITRWMDGGPPPERAGGVQNPLPGLETPPCR